ncbi:MAG: stage III sporulation AC/AD family protein [Oscillibacter sp.]|jgi:stage III sporulation protein AD|nr:stage III sporulation AC/AD family protein [Oscillibacter sp.]
MELTIQICGVCVIGALLVLVLKKGTPELALLVTLAGVTVVFLCLAEPFRQLLDFLQELSEKSGVSAELFTPLYKTVGIALVVRIGSSLCRDAGEGALSAVIETAGSVCAVLVALPLLRAALSLLMELMQS